MAALDARPRRGSARPSCDLAGAAFPWRTIRGQECSGYWPAGTAAFHINADIAARGASATWPATGDADFERDIGLELLVETPGCWSRSATTTGTAAGTSTG